MNVRFLVPWRSDGEYRDKLWDFTRARWERDFPHIPIRIGSSPPGAFNRSAAINDAAKGEWDVAVILDADVMCEKEQVEAAIGWAEMKGHLTFAFREYCGLTPHMTALVLAQETVRNRWTDPPAPLPLHAGVRFRSKVHESSVVVVRRDLWDELGGFDERFVGWGQEDVAFAHAARLIGGHTARITGIVWHLWHARSIDRNNMLPSYRANQELGQRYRDVSDREGMLELLKERDDARASVRVDLPA